MQKIDCKNFFQGFRLYRLAILMQPFLWNFFLMSKQDFYISQFDCLNVKLDNVTKAFWPSNFRTQVFNSVFCSKAPTWLTKLAPEDALVMQEEAWNAYPMCKSGLYSYLGICIHEECLFSASFQFSFLNTSNDFLVVVWNSTSCSYKGILCFDVCFSFMGISS